MSDNAPYSSRSRASSINGHGNTTEITGEDETPRSIASLRNKFESLAAAGSAGQGSTGVGGSQGMHVARSSVDLAGGRSRASSNGTDGGTIDKLAPPRPMSRPSTPLARSPVIPQFSSSPPQIGSSSSLASTYRPPAPSIPPGRPTTPKPMRPPSPNPITSSLAPAGSDDHMPRSTFSSTPLASPALGSGGFPTSPKPLRRAAPTLPNKPTMSSASPAVPENGTDVADAEPTQSVRALRERFGAAPQPSSDTSGSKSTLEKSASADVSPRPLAPPMAVKQVSAPAIKLISTRGNVSNALPLSPASEISDERSLPSSSPIVVEEPMSLPRPSSPVPPVSRSASPAPPPPNRASKPPPRLTPPLSRENSGPDITPTLSSAPPQLPARRPTNHSSEPIEMATSPPPLPGNKPNMSPALGFVPPASSDAGIGPPLLPTRSRANTVNKNETDGAAGQSMAPLLPRRLPARTTTVPPSTSSVPPPPAHPSSPARSRVSSADNLPPPPVRTATGASMYSSPSKRSGPPPGQNEDDSGGEDDDEDEAAPISGLSGTAKRAMEDVPDSTNANRRPPSYVPPVKIHDSHNMSAFAVYGRHVCTGSHHVRIYDTLLSDHPIFVIDQRDTGLEFRVKEPRITALCFRPGATAAEEGRYLWVGTKDGHIWELDISTGQVTHTRPFVHASAIIHIFRNRKSLLTLDESGKLLVFDVGDTEGQTPTLNRTLRVGDKFTYARMICGRLWTSTGPASRSTTSASSKGPTIRVYDPCAPDAMPPPKTLFTTEWTGAVTSATHIPLRPDEIYLGHEGGFISIWSAADLSCLQVLKVSTTDILALEGVGARLWTGNRKGHIHVYDIADRPWQTTNIWTAHSDWPVHTIIVDPWSIEHAGRYTVWSSARDSFKAWDGLLAVDWIDKQMVTREPDYCGFREARMLVCSWNIDSAKPTDLVGSEANSKFLDELLHSVDSPDIIVFGFQEVIPLTDKKLTAKTLLFGGKTKDAGASADKVSHAYRQWMEKLQQAVRMAMPSDCPYVKIHSESLVGLFSCIFVKASEKEALRNLDISTIKRGIGGIYGNKGAIVARMIIDDTSICFINVHLAAGQRQKASRNADLAAIMEDKAVFSAADERPFVHGGDGTAILDHEMVILNGDLNYRIDQRRENVVSSIAAGELSYLLEHDQLRKEMRGNHAFRLRSFEEAQITFAPTYKYNPGTSEYDTSEKRRIPAWCDRILYKKCDRIRPLDYRRYEPTVSDHKPISAGFALTVKSVDPTQMLEVRRQVTADWAKREDEMLCLLAEAFAKFM